MRLSPLLWPGQFVAFRELLPKGKVLGIGAHARGEADFFAKAGYDYHVMEKTMGEIIKGFHYVKFPSGPFDGFWIAGIFPHLPRNALVPTLDVIHRAMRLGAVGFLTVKEGSGERYRYCRDQGPANEWFISLYRDEEFRAALERGRFDVIHRARQRDPDDPEGPAEWLGYLVKVI